MEARISLLIRVSVSPMAPPTSPKSPKSTRNATPVKASPRNRTGIKPFSLWYLERPRRSYSTFVPGTFGRGLDLLLQRFEDFVITPAMAAAIKASKSVSRFGTCGVSWRWTDEC
jgi:hypothetical protein